MTERSGPHAYVERVVALRSQGLIYQRIATELGISLRAVRRVLAPDFDEKERSVNRRRRVAKREHDRTHRATCARCGGPMGQGTARADGSRRALKGDVCKSCRQTRRGERALKMLELRQRGLSNREIAAAVSVSKATVTEELSRMRALGFDVPVDRYAADRGRRPSAVTLTRDALYLGRDLLAQGVDVPAIRERAA